MAYDSNNICNSDATKWWNNSQQPSVNYSRKSKIFAATALVGVIAVAIAILMHCGIIDPSHIPSLGHTLASKNFINILGYSGAVCSIAGTILGIHNHRKETQVLEELLNDNGID